MPKSVAYLSNVVCTDDKFLGLSAEARIAYVLLQFEADGDGVVASPQRVARSYGIDDDSIEELRQGGYIDEIKVSEDGTTLLLILHWWVHNKADRYNYYGGAYSELVHSSYNDPSKLEPKAARVYRRRTDCEQTDSSL